MPKNVFNRWPKPFRNRNNFHFALGEIEQRQVFFQHKKRELMIFDIGHKVI